MGVDWNSQNVNWGQAFGTTTLPAGSGASSPPSGWSADEWAAYNNADAWVYSQNTQGLLGNTGGHPSKGHLDPGYFDKWYNSQTGQAYLNQLGDANTPASQQQSPQEQAQNQLLAFAQQMMGPLNMQDPVTQSIMKGAAQSGSNAAANQGIGGGLSVQNTQASVSGALSNLATQRQQLGMQALGGAANIGLQNTAQQYQMYLNGLAQKSSAMGSVFGLVGGAAGAYFGGPAGAAAGMQLGQSAGMGLAGLSAPAYSGPGAYSPSGNGTMSSGGGSTSYIPGA